MFIIHCAAIFTSFLHQFFMAQLWKLFKDFLQRRLSELIISVVVPDLPNTKTCRDDMIQHPHFWLSISTKKADHCTDFVFNNRCCTVLNNRARVLKWTIKSPRWLERPLKEVKNFKTWVFDISILRYISRAVTTKTKNHRACKS